MSEIWGIPSPYNSGPKNYIFGRLRNLTATLTAYIFGVKQDISGQVRCKLPGGCYIIPKQHELWCTNGFKLGVSFHPPSSLLFRCCVCVVPAEHCEPGEFYSRDDERCVSCPRDSYQPIAGQNFCVDCPGYTQTDTDGANSSLQCKGTLIISPLREITCHMKCV